MGATAGRSELNNSQETKILPNLPHLTHQQPKIFGPFFLKAKNTTYTVPAGIFSSLQLIPIYLSWNQIARNLIISQLRLARVLFRLIVRARIDSLKHNTRFVRPVTCKLPKNIYTTSTPMFLEPSTEKFMTNSFSLGKSRKILSPLWQADWSNIQ